MKHLANLLVTRYCLTALLCAPCLAAAQQAARPAYSPPPAALSSGSVVQVAVSLLLVLAAVVLVAWLLRRIHLPQQGAGNQIRVLSGAAVGQRERVVLIEIQDTWLVVGVAPGQVRVLHTMPKAEAAASQTDAPAVADGKFQGWLKQVMEKRNA